MDEGLLNKSADLEIERSSGKAAAEKKLATALIVILLVRLLIHAPFGTICVLAELVCDHSVISREKLD